MTVLPRPPHNPANDIEANIVLAAPTASGLSADDPTTGPDSGCRCCPTTSFPST